MEDVFCPVLQVYEFAPLAVNVVVLPLHITLVPVTLIVGKALTVTLEFTEATQPFPLVPNMVYTVLLTGLTMAEPEE